MKHRGRHTHRLRREPEERLFAEAWDKHNELGRTLAWLLHEGEHTGNPQRVTDREKEVAATVVQWLGSEVGRHFLAELGYAKPLPLEEKECRVSFDKKRPRKKK